MAWQEGYEAGRAAPPLRELRDEEIDAVWNNRVPCWSESIARKTFARAILAAARSKT